MSAAVKDKVTKQVEDRLATLNEGIEVEERTFRERIADKVAERDELAALLKRVKGPESRKPGSRKSGNRQTEFVKIVKANPGISASDAAKQMGINPNYVYRVARDASEAGLVRKNGREFHAVETA